MKTDNAWFVVPGLTTALPPTAVPSRRSQHHPHVTLKGAGTGWPPAPQECTAHILSLALSGGSSQDINHHLNRQPRKARLHQAAPPEHHTPACTVSDATSARCASCLRAGTPAVKRCLSSPHRAQKEQGGQAEGGKMAR